MLLEIVWKRGNASSQLRGRARFQMRALVVVLTAKKTVVFIIPTARLFGVVSEA